MALLLREDDVRSLLTMDEALEVVEASFRALARGEAANFPKQRSSMPGVSLNVLCAVWTTRDAAGIKCYPIVRKDVTVGSSFTLLIYRISTGTMIGMMEANALGQVRTGAASGIATRHLARRNSRVMTLFGAGWQAESQLEAIARVLPGLERVNVVGRSLERARDFCRTMTDRLRLEVVTSVDPQQAVAEADVVTTATGSRQPVFDGRWLRPGVHVNAIGSNYADKQEVDATTVQRADRIVVDDLAVARSECGDLLAVADLNWNAVEPLCNIVEGSVPGRTSSDQITLFESHGLGLEDLAAGCRVLERARERGIGTEIPVR